MKNFIEVTEKETLNKVSIQISHITSITEGTVACKISFGTGNFIFVTESYNAVRCLSLGYS